MTNRWHRLDWPAPEWVQAGYTTREGGVSLAPYVGFNLADHVGDDLKSVERNRVLLSKALPCAPRWLKQEHGIRVMEWGAASVLDTVLADAAITCAPHVVCAVLTADCLPIFFCSRTQPVVGLAHAGWRGLAQGIVEATVARLRERSGACDWIAYLGPAIGPTAFEVGDDVRQRFIAMSAQDAHYFTPSKDAKWMANLSGLARKRLERLGVEVFGGAECTFTDESRFYSHRRATLRGEHATGRMASLIWFTPDF